MFSTRPSVHFPTFHNCVFDLYREADPTGGVPGSDRDPGL